MSGMHEAIAREAARLGNGRFGTQARPEAGDVVLVTRPKVVRVVGAGIPARTSAQIEQEELRDSRHRARYALGGRVETELDPLALRPGDELVDTYGDPHEVTDAPQRHADGTITVGSFTFERGESANVRYLAPDAANDGAGR